MDFKKVTVGFFAAVMAMTSVCFADPETPVTTDVPATDPVPETTTTAQPQWEDTETTTTTTAQTWETTTWGTTTSYSYVPDTPTSTPTVVKLVVSEVKDKKFTAKINIQCDHLISNASISVGYDDSLVEFEKCETNDKAGGMAVDNAFAGKFVYNYVNADGTDFDGDYATLHFKVADEKLTSTVLYLTVNSLDDENLNAISNQVENGIVKYQDAADVQQDDSDYIEIDVDYSKYPIAPEDIGLTDVESVTVANGEVLIFEDGKFQTLSTGETKIDIVYKDGSVGHFKIVIKEPEAVKLESSEAEATSKAASPVTEEKSGSLKGKEEVVEGTITIGCGEFAAVETLAKICKTYKEKYPLVQIVLHTATADAVYEMMNKGLVDIALFMEPVDTEGLDYIRITDCDHWCVGMRPDDPLAEKEFIKKEDLIGKPLILPERMNVQSELANWFGKDFSKLQIAFTSNLGTNAGVMAANGLGYPVSIEGAAKYWREDILVQRRISPEIKTSTVIAWRRNIPYSLAVRKMIEEINAFQA